MLQLSGFADEIGPDLQQQIALCRETGVTHLELRSVGGTNVLQFTDDQRRDIRQQLRDNGLGVVSIGSPCGKRPIDTPESELMDQFKAAIDMGVHFDAPLIRVFSYYPPGGEGKGEVSAIGGRVIELLRKQVELLDQRDITTIMVHENEKGVYGDTGDRCLELMEQVDSPRLRSAFDFANFIQCGENPADNWPKLRGYTNHIHIKDAVTGTGKVVPAGEGDGHIGEILKDAYANGYRGFVSMEPHLKVAGHSHGETGPELWKTAVNALRKICREHGVPLAGN